MQCSRDCTLLNSNHGIGYFKPITLSSYKIVLINKLTVKDPLESSDHKMMELYLEFE